jgi:hypothetical protein
LIIVSRVPAPAGATGGQLVERLADDAVSSSTASSRRSLTTTAGELVAASSSASAVRRRACDLLGVVGAAADEPRAAAPRRRRRDEDLQRLGHRLAHLARALDLDLEHDRVPGAQPALELGAQRAVALPEYVACSTNSPASTRRWKSASARKW